MTHDRHFLTYARRVTTFAYDYGQLYLYDASTDLSSFENPYLDALDAATETGLSVGARSGIVDVLMPRQENFHAEMRIVDSEPEPRDADHVVEFDLQAPSGRLILEGSGGSGTLELDVPAGRYRARLSGQGFDAAAAWQYRDEGDPGDRYLLELWPSAEDRAPAELKRWAGFLN